VERRKIKYEKPKAVSLGPINPAFAQTCSIGTAAAEGCSTGNDPDTIAYCPDGNVATGNCYTHGHTAGQACNTGDSPGF